MYGMNIKYKQRIVSIDKRKTYKTALFDDHNTK